MRMGWEGIAEEREYTRFCACGRDVATRKIHVDST
jgi:hypothetical protein